MLHHARYLAFQALRSVQAGAFADIALDRVLQTDPVSSSDRRLVTELVYGSVRRQRTLDALIDQFAKKPALQQPPDLRLVLHLGLYQLRYLDQVPAAAAVDTTVELAKQVGLQGLSGFVNGLLRQYLRQSIDRDCLQLPADPVVAMAIQHSYPDWIVQLWWDQFGQAEAQQLCEWFNRSPLIDLRVNPLRTSIEQVRESMAAAGVIVQPIPGLPQALRLPTGAGSIQQLPGFAEGWWTVQDSSAQLVSYLLNPQPGERIIDACAAPGGKTTHIAELIQDQGEIWAFDRYASRLKKLKETLQRLQLRSIQISPQDSRTHHQFTAQADRVLLDAPCSGLGTLHRHADARWRQTPETVQQLTQLQTELLDQAATWVKPTGSLVYATCTLHPAENEAIIQQFLDHHPDWQLLSPEPHTPAAHWLQSAPASATDRPLDRSIKVLPHHHNMDGFFMARLAPVGSGLN
ncbi:MAG: 16S rRNA (cytosine(967)-C(5))-methyltransferase [Elainella sp. Prado103]|jgi:16S rRNA (cytosine967-C5)-methyltransferase|nr:16S rRNA (cytosine(967)-C(5))-methyltransferase [Elainella sp. Prado103]